MSAAAEPSPPSPPSNGSPYQRLDRRSPPAVEHADDAGSSDGGNNEGGSPPPGGNMQDTAAAGNDDDDDDGGGMSLSELLYGASSYHAIAKPVSLTMILAALATIYINDESTLEEGAQDLADAYTVFSVGGTDQSTAENVGLSLLNTLIIVCFIGLLTFGIVLLYKYRCMKCLIGYMIFSSAMLLGFLGWVVFGVAVEIYRLPIDKFSFYFTLWNFAVVGTLSIFWQKGIPMFVTQGYLVATSVILAWQLSHFDAWTAWALLIMLALYDLCAVLTPCGPLKALVNLMQEDDAPDMPGLLYEAGLPAEAQRPGRSRNNNGQSRATSEQSSRQSTSSTTGGGEAANVRADGPPLSASAATAPGVSVGGSGDDPSAEEAQGPSTTAGAEFQNEDAAAASKAGNVEMSTTSRRAGDAHGSQQISSPAATANGAPSSASRLATEAAATPEPAPSGVLPLAIAKIYRLPLAQPDALRNRRDNNGSSFPLLEDDEEGAASPNALLARDFTPEELLSDVEVVFPRNGGRIDRADGSDGRPRYVVKDRNGAVKRTLLLNDQGKVFEEIERSGDDDSEDGGSGNSIKLGLGDFIFYSVLVSKAAQYSFTTFVACFLVILAGLGGTLVLLAVYHQALPALPISILLGVIFYVITRLVVEPWIEDMLRTPFYV